MQVEVVGKPIKYRLKSGEELTLQPGVPTELPDNAAQQLLRKAAGLVRRVQPDHVTIEPVAENVRLVYWEQVDGSIVGGCKPECVAEVGERFWVIVTYDGNPRWVRSDRLRSRQQFETQEPVRLVELIKEARR